MSYDIWLDADLGGDEPTTVWDCWNYTSNCGRMWRLAGADLAEFHGKRAGDCAPILAAAIADMKANPGKYIPLNPENGWGSYETLVPALERLHEAFARMPDTTVVVWR